MLEFSLMVFFIINTIKLDFGFHLEWTSQQQESLNQAVEHFWIFLDWKKDFNRPFPHTYIHTTIHVGDNNFSCSHEQPKPWNHFSMTTCKNFCVGKHNILKVGVCSSSVTNTYYTFTCCEEKGHWLESTCARITLVQWKTTKWHGKISLHAKNLQAGRQTSREQVTHVYALL